MKLKLIATSTAIALASPSISAMELYKDDKNSLELGGFFGANYVMADGTDEVSNGNSRINFTFTHQLNNGWSAFAKAEWAVSLVSNNSDLVLNGDSNLAQGEASDTLSSRLGFVGMAHDTWGSITMGKQWGSIYNVTGVTDNFYVFGGDGAGSFALGDGGYTGAGRAEQAIQYNNSFGNLAVSVQMQGTEEVVALDELLPGIPNNDLELIYDNSYGVALTYELPFNLSVGVGYNEASVEMTGLNSAISEELDDTLTAVSVTYGTLGQPGLYAAVVATEGENHEFNDEGDMIAETTGVEAMVTYRFANDLEVLGGYNSVKSDDGDDYEKAYMVAGVAYHFSDHFRVHSEYKLDESTNFDGSENDDDILAVGARFSF